MPHILPDHTDSPFDPGAGWREATGDEYYNSDPTLRFDDSATGVTTYWVRDEPAPPLPTAPYTVVRTGPLRWLKCGLWRDGNMVGNPKAWLLLSGESPAESRAVRASHLQGQVIYDQKHVLKQVQEYGFQVLAEPRATTANAVLAEIADRLEIPNDGRGTVRAGVRAELYAIAREFGAEL